jgi:osmotically-inducible protein OsmY
VLLALATAGCESFGKCTSEACVADAKITADVRALLDGHSELGSPGSIRVQTIKGVVYLNGEVDTDLERRDAETIAYQAADVKEVVNSVAVRGNSR